MRQTLQYMVSSSSSSTKIGFSRVPMGLEWNGVGRRDCGGGGIGGGGEYFGKTIVIEGVGRWHHADGLGDGVRLYGGKGSSLSDKRGVDRE